MTTRTTALASPDPDRPRRGASTTTLTVAELREELGRKLVQRRKRAGLSRTNLARQIGYSDGAISTAEYGQQTRSRHFWELVDQYLHADGVLLAAADAVNLRQAAVNRQKQAVKEVMPALAPYRQVQKVNRAFADRLSTLAAHRQRHPHMVETAARQQSRIEHEVRALTETIRMLLNRPGFTHHDVLIDLWRTLLTHDPYAATFLSAAALLELAQTQP